MINPFVFGKVATGRYFCDRDQEIRELEETLEGGMSVALISPRRYGKTSLIVNTFEHNGSLNGVYIDLMGITELGEFLSLYTSRIVDSQGTLRQKFFNNAKNWLSGVRKINVDMGSDPFKVHLEIEPTNKEGISQVISLPEKLNKKICIALDEFQDIVNIREVDLMVELRKSFQFFKNTSFIFSGSRRHMMRDIFNNPDRPFYRFSKVMNLSPLKLHEAALFVSQKFEETGISAKIATARKLVETVQGHPYYVQALAHYAWLEATPSRKLLEDHISSSLDRVMRLERGSFETLWSSLSMNQRQVLKLLSVDRSPYEAPFSSGSVKRALDTLIFMDKVEQNDTYSIVDPLLKLWLKELTEGLA